MTFIKTQSGAVFRLEPWLRCLPYVDVFALSGESNSNLIDALVTEASCILSKAIPRPSEIDKTNDAVAPCYRKAAVNVHPDRFPGDVLKAVLFLELSSAYDAFRSFEPRQDYLSHMLRIAIMGAPPEWLQMAHHGWHKTFRSSDTQQARPQRSAATGPARNRSSRSKRTLRIEGGNWNEPPGTLIINNVDEWTRTVEACVQFKDIDAYGRSCSSIEVGGWPDNDKTKEERLLLLEASALEHAMDRARQSEGGVQVQFKLPQYGNWVVFWKARYWSLAMLKTTPNSNLREIDVIHPYIQKARKEKPLLLEMAKRHTSEIRRMLQQLQATQQMTKEQADVKYWRMHKLLSKGQSISRQLHTKLEMLEREPSDCKELMALTSMLGEGVVAKANLDDRISAVQRKDTLKHFKQSMAAMLERGEASQWIVDVTQEELVNHGGEVNRLYQLLVEGKKAQNPLLVDSLTLRNASQRADLFSEKQRAALTERSSEVEAQMLAEAEHLMKEDEETKAEQQFEAEIDELKELADGGSIVRIIGLTTRPDLNHSIGRFTGLVSAKGSNNQRRYGIELLGSGKEISLKRENFELCESHEVGEKLELAAVDQAAEKTDADFEAAFNLVTRGRKREDEETGTAAPKPGAWQTGGISGLARVRESGAFEPSKPLAKVPVEPSQYWLLVKSCLKPSVVVLIQNKDVPQLIGPGGKNQQRLVREFGVKSIYAQQELVRPDGWCPLLIEGHPECVQKVVEDLLLSFFQSDALLTLREWARAKF